MSTKPRILVTSAAGHTGAAAVRELLAQGFPVRAFVRREDARSDKLKQAGAKIFTGDLFDMRDLRRALVDVQRAYHVPPFAPNLLHGTMLSRPTAPSGWRSPNSNDWRCSTRAQRPDRCGRAWWERSRVEARRALTRRTLFGKRELYLQASWRNEP